MLKQVIIVALGIVMLAAIGVFIVQPNVTGSLNPTTYDARMVSQTGIVFEGNENAYEQGLPFLTQAKIQGQSGVKLTIDVIYIVPVNNGKAYKLSVMPNGSGFYNSDNTLTYGRGKVRVHIHYSPDSIFKRGISTSELQFYITEKDVSSPLAAIENVGETVYERRVELDKKWRKPKPGPMNIGPAGFMVEGSDLIQRKRGVF